MSNNKKDLKAISTQVLKQIRLSHKNLTKTEIRFVCSKIYNSLREKKG